MASKILISYFVLYSCVHDVSSFSLRTNSMSLRRQVALQRPIALYRGDGVMMNAEIPNCRKLIVTSAVDGDVDSCDTNHHYSFDNIQPVRTMIEPTGTNQMTRYNRRDMLSLIGTNIISAAIITSSVAAAEVMVVDGRNDVKDGNDDGTNNNNLTTQLFNPDGSLKDTGLVVEAKERTVNLFPTKEPQVIWVDATPLSSSAASSSNRISSNAEASTADSILQYNVPMKWDNNYIDSTTKESACTRIYTYRIPFQSMNSGTGATGSTAMTSDPEAATKGKRRTISRSITNNSGTASNRRLQISDIVDALPSDDIIRQSLRNADIMGGNVRRPTSSAASITKMQSSTNDAASKTSTDRTYSEFDLAVAPTTCSGGESEDLRLGFCPYDRIFLISATAMDSEASIMKNTDDLNSGTVDSRTPSGYLSILVVESTRSEWQRANADLRRVRGSFTVL